MKKIILFLMLTGCTQQEQALPDPRICAAPPKTIGPGDWGACIHRQAYQLAKAPGSNLDIARAVEATCGAEIAYQVNKAKPDERLQLLADINRSTPGIALYRVTQARAGNCVVPD